MDIGCFYLKIGYSIGYPIEYPIFKNKLNIKEVRLPIGSLTSKSFYATCCVLCVPYLTSFQLGSFLFISKVVEVEQE
jgi:hypothetical protein